MNKIAHHGQQMQLEQATYTSQQLQNEQVACPDQQMQMNKQPTLVNKSNMNK